ncbi:hypothetical protein [Acidocella sp. KAb 2-4]|uniref:hypothetical protein n=1 Tax=Acidocella sp. KAb 2-4 TaxID=2885158 RepID=UPI001D08591D|nr:hypothetical protein [Acidocella sp. KAb 2-4]MCB5943947.1 hypothetical protein [Acidocella sp. KAb 2-4]
MKTKKSAAAWRAEEERIRAAARDAFTVLGLPEPADLNEFLTLCDACIERLTTEAASLAVLRREMAAVLARGNRRAPAKGKVAAH